MGRSKRASASHGGAQGAAASAPSMATGTQFSTAGHIDTGKRRASRNGAVVFAIVVFAVAFGLVLAATQVLLGGIGLGALVAAAIVGWLASSSVHIVLEWEKAVVLRLGKFNRVAGPGIVFTWPIVEFYTLRVDQRVSATYFGAEETLTSDLVPINVDAVVFWMVWSAKSAAVEVEDYASAVSWIAQTAMRKAIGRATVAEVATRRDQLDEELKEAIDRSSTRGASPSSTWRSATSCCRRSCRRPWRRKPWPSARRTPAWCWPRPRRTSPRCSWMHPRCTPATPTP